MREEVQPQSTSQSIVQQFQELQQMLKSYLEFLTPGETQARAAHDHLTM